MYLNGSLQVIWQNEICRDLLDIWQLHFNCSYASSFLENKQVSCVVFWKQLLYIKEHLCCSNICALVSIFQTELTAQSTNKRTDCLLLAVFCLAFNSTSCFRWFVQDLTHLHHWKVQKFRLSHPLVQAVPPTSSGTGVWGTS